MDAAAATVGPFFEDYYSSSGGQVNNSSIDSLGTWEDGPIEASADRF